MRVEWSGRALAERDAIFDFIVAERPKAAELIDQRIFEQVHLLGRFPCLGRLGRVPGTRELVIHETPFVVSYKIGDDAIRVLRILHSSRRWPGGGR